MGIPHRSIRGQLPLAVAQGSLTALDPLALLSNIAGIPLVLPGSCPPLLAAPALVSQADGAQFDVLPRVTPVDWEAVPGAAS